MVRMDAGGGPPAPNPTRCQAYSFCLYKTNVSSKRQKNQNGKNESKTKGPRKVYKKERGRQVVKKKEEMETLC